MTSGSRPEYLCVDAFMQDMVGARALQSALELGLIDELSRNQPLDLNAMLRQSGLDPPALNLLLGMLRANAVIEQRDAGWQLSAPFGMALRYRDILQAKLEFAALVAGDFVEMFTTLLAQPGRFFERSRIFDLFSYDRCMESTPANLALTRRWMRFTTALTRYEAQACLDRHDFSGCRRLLDVGGNSGEFALRICRAHPRVHATVLDLPLVCDIGREHLRGEAEAARIEFVATGTAPTAFPAGFDTLCFKSMLHDWPDDEMHQFLERARQALDDGGRLIIFERGMLDVGIGQIPYSLIPIMLFFRSYRSPQDYARHLERIGFRDIRIQPVELDVPFMLITAVK